MNRDELVGALEDDLPPNLVKDLIDNFLALRQDVITGTLGRASPGKFVETFVQVLQFLDTGKYDNSPAVDSFLQQIESRQSSVSDGLRICGARVARAMYTLRNKRNVAHKGEVDPNISDLGFLHHAAQWIVAELLRTTTSLSMEEAGQLVQLVQAPAGSLVEDFGDRKLVLGQMSCKEEALVLLHSHYPDVVSFDRIVGSMDRFAKRTVSNTFRGLWKNKLVDGSATTGYRLTALGFDEAIEIVKRHI